jgi:hypothetical protein
MCFALKIESSYEWGVLNTMREPTEEVPKGVDLINAEQNDTSKEVVLYRPSTPIKSDPDIVEFDWQNDTELFVTDISEKKRDLPQQNEGTHFKVEDYVMTTKAPIGGNNEILMSTGSTHAHPKKSKKSKTGGRKPAKPGGRTPAEIAREIDLRIKQQAEKRRMQPEDLEERGKPKRRKKNSEDTKNTTTGILRSLLGQAVIAPLTVGFVEAPVFAGSTRDEYFKTLRENCPKGFDRKRLNIDLNRLKNDAKVFSHGMKVDGSNWKLKGLKTCECNTRYP